MGAFGVGKTQLLYHLFKYAWKECGVPALYTSLRNILDSVKPYIRNSYSSQISEFLNKLKDIALQKLRSMKNQFNGAPSLSGLWLPNMPGHPDNMPPAGLFQCIDVPEEKAVNAIDGALEKRGGIIILIDEVESAFDDLLKSIGGNFRDLVDSICTGAYGIYLVFSVSYISYYELFLSKFSADIAAQRRVTLVTIPTIHPDRLYELLNQEGNGMTLHEKSNTLWWLTRGKIGWLSYLSTIAGADKGPDYSGLRDLTRMPEIDTPLSEGVRVLDKDGLNRIENEKCKEDEKCRMLLRYFILNIEPKELSGKLQQLPFFEQSSLARLGNAIVMCNNLMEVSEVVDAVVKDLDHLIENRGIPVPPDVRELISSRVRESLDVILSAFAKRDGDRKQICIGAPYMYDFPEVLRSYVEVLFDLLTAYIAENYPSTGERDKWLSDLLYQLQYYVVTDFEKPFVFEELKKSLDERGVLGSKYAIIAPWVVRDLMPMYFWNPLITQRPLTIGDLEKRLAEALKDTSMREKVVDTIDMVSKYIVEKQENVYVYLIPVLRNDYMDPDVKVALQNLIVSIVNRHRKDLKSRSQLVFILTTDNDDVSREIERALQSDSLLELLLHSIPRVHIKLLDSARLSDFVKSLYYLVLKEYPDRRLEEIENTALMASLRHKMKYFKDVLGNWVAKVVEGIREEYNKKIDDLSRNIADHIRRTVRGIETIASRGGKWSSSTRIYAALITSMYGSSDELRRIIDILSSILQPHSLIDVRALPSIYQELLQRREVTIDVLPLLDVPEIYKMLEVVIKELRASTIEDIIKGIVEESPLPLFDDFESMVNKIERGVNRGHVDIMFRSLLLAHALLANRNSIDSLYQNRYKEVVNEIDSLKELLNAISNVSRDLCKDTPLCIEINIRHERKQDITLKKSLDDVEKALKLLEDWRKSGESIDKRIIMALFTTFGIHDGETFLDQLQQSIRKWYEKLNAIYNDLEFLYKNLKSLTYPYIGQKTPRSIIFSSLNDVEGRPGSELKRLKEEVAKYLQDLKLIEEDIKTLIEGLKSSTDTVLRTLDNVINSI